MADVIVILPQVPVEVLAAEGRERFVSKKLEEHANYVRRTRIPRALDALRAGRLEPSKLGTMEAFTEALYWDSHSSRVLSARKPSLKTLTEVSGTLPSFLARHFSNDGEGLVDRADLSELISTLDPCIGAVIQAVGTELVRSGLQEAEFDQWRREAIKQAPWRIPSSTAVPDKIVRVGEFLVILRLAAIRASQVGKDLGVYSLGGTNYPVSIDYKRLLEAFRARDEAYLRGMIEAEIRRDLLVVRVAAEKDLSLMDDIRLLAQTYPRSSVELQEDDELLGHYLAMEAGLDLPATREGDESFRFELTAEQLGRLAAALRSVAVRKTNPDAIGDLAGEFGFSEEMAEGVLGWFSGNGNDDHVQKRKKLEKFVAQAQEGKAKLLFVHKEEA